MQLIRNTFTIADLNKWLEERTLIVNHNYQRLQGLWHKNARSYFIDTILNNYPFPKITIRQTINLKTRQSIREIIDGQQRMMTINDFVNNKLTLSSVSELYKGQKFSDLDEDIQSEFLAYEISVDTLVGMPENEILEIFRRINSYTLPLNASEKRHASYQGEFKWFIKNIVELYTPMFKKYKIDIKAIDAKTKSKSQRRNCNFERLRQFPSNPRACIAMFICSAISMLRINNEPSIEAAVLSSALKPRFRSFLPALARSI